MSAPTGPAPLLVVPDRPDFLLWTTAVDAAAAVRRVWDEAGLVVRVVRGARTTNLRDLCDEVGAAFEFPSYYGRNLDALHECITDLEWLPTRTGYVMVIDEPFAVLADERRPGALSSLVGLLQSAIAEWAEPVAVGEYWDRPPVPFHVVLHAALEEAGPVVERWAAAGAVVRDLA